MVLINWKDAPLQAECIGDVTGMSWKFFVISRDIKTLPNGKRHIGLKNIWGSKSKGNDLNSVCLKLFKTKEIHCFCYTPSAFNVFLHPYNYVPMKPPWKISSSAWFWQKIGEMAEPAFFAILKWLVATQSRRPSFTHQEMHFRKLFLWLHWYWIHSILFVTLI